MDQLFEKFQGDEDLKDINHILEMAQENREGRESINPYDP